MSLDKNDIVGTEESSDRSCKTPRWRILKAQLNNYLPADFKREYHQAVEPILLDVRQPHEYEQFHLPDAIHINYFADDFWDEAEKLPKDRPIFVYCRSGRRSLRVCTLMRNGGFESGSIYHLDGGLNAWLEVFGTDK